MSLPDLSASALSAFLPRSTENMLTTKAAGTSICTTVSLLPEGDQEVPVSVQATPVPYAPLPTVVLLLLLVLQL